MLDQQPCRKTEGLDSLRRVAHLRRKLRPHLARDNEPICCSHRRGRRDKQIPQWTALRGPIWFAAHGPTVLLNVAVPYRDSDKSNGATRRPALLDCRSRDSKTPRKTLDSPRKPSGKPAGARYSFTSNTRPACLGSRAAARATPEASIRQPCTPDILYERSGDIVGTCHFLVCRCPKCDRF